jgi:hypothetical protein
MDYVHYWEVGAPTGVAAPGAINPRYATEFEISDRSFYHSAPAFLNSLPKELRQYNNIRSKTQPLYFQRLGIDSAPLVSARSISPQQIAWRH